MWAAVRVVVAALLVVAAIALAGLVYLRSTGLRGQPEPGPIETRVARAIRGLAIPGEIKTRTNPLAASADALTPGLEHFARYCAICHGNNGEGAAISRGPRRRSSCPARPDLPVSAREAGCGNPD